MLDKLQKLKSETIDVVEDGSEAEKLLTERAKLNYQINILKRVHHFSFQSFTFILVFNMLIRHLKKNPKI